MASITYPARTHRIHKNKLSQELPGRMLEVKEIHEVNLGLVISSIILALAVIAIAWLVTMNSAQRLKIDPLKDVAMTSSWATSHPATMPLGR